MPQFRYVARNTEGKLIDGVVTCNDRSAAIRQVEQQRCVPIKIEALNGAANGNGDAKPAPAANGSKASPAARKSTQSQTSQSPVATGPVTTMSHSQQYLFTEQLALLLGAGMTLDEALGILTKRMKHPRLHGISQALHQALVDGRSLSQALRDYPKIFSPLYVNMVAAGEASGALSDILKRLVLHLADVKALRDRVQQALIYPALLVVAGFGLIVIFMTVMVPQLMGFFTKTGGALPLPTRILLKSNEILTGYWWVALIIAFATPTVWKMFTSRPEGRKAWDAFTWRIPLFSQVMRNRYYAQFARTLGTLMQNGVTLLRALELLEEISGNEWVRLKMIDVRRAVVDGATLSVALDEQKLFPELFIDMMGVGEQTGRFGETMQNIADVYERELDKQVKVISALIPPLVMLVIASVVGFVVYGILSAVFGMTNALRGGVH